MVIIHNPTPCILHLDIENRIVVAGDNTIPPEHRSRDSDRNWIKITEPEPTALSLTGINRYIGTDDKGWDAEIYEDSDDKTNPINCSRKQQSPNRVKRWRAKKKRARKRRR